ncbi:hypothetical protein [Streptomyces sp. RKAG290]|uniref:DUF7144 family membrane protein n=1 Tax=Streptomyces sp. RKAG290 TaxID=2888348 RepID=UPI0020333CCF|nr:hypothetical protein [Streptomyces sp. RKAG290]MCM2414375.1 hypothetical protein [Streptomyces sp. RKAG290]
MAQTAPTPGSSSPRPSDPGGVNPWAAGGTMFAGVLLVVDGILGVIKGIAGIATDDVYARINNYVFEFNVTTWGWIHLILGIVIAVVGLGILRGAAWARWVGVGLAALNMIANFMWLPYQPIWAVVSLAIDTFVIWALCTDRSKSVV